MVKQALLDENRRLWDAVVPEHVLSAHYDLRGFLQGGDPLDPLLSDALGEVRGRQVLQLMCHLGLEALGVARRGASVTGLDFSAQAVEVARKLAVREGLEATFVQSEVTQAPSVLQRTFDMVFSAWGVLMWLPDLGAWARAVAQLVAPGGSFHLVEVHPLAWTFLDPDDVGRVRREPVQDYFGDGGPRSQTVDGSYAGVTVEPGHRQHLWTWTLGDVVTALVQAGLRIEALAEHDGANSQVLPALVQSGDGLWRWPEGAARLPLSLSLRALRPG